MLFNDKLSNEEKISAAKALDKNLTPYLIQAILKDGLLSVYQGADSKNTPRKLSDLEILNEVGHLDFRKGDLIHPIESRNSHFFRKVPAFLDELSKIKDCTGVAVFNVGEGFSQACVARAHVMEPDRVVLRSMALQFCEISRKTIEEATPSLREMVSNGSKSIAAALATIACCINDRPMLDILKDYDPGCLSRPVGTWPGNPEIAASAAAFAVLHASVEIYSTILPFELKTCLQDQEGNFLSQGELLLKNKAIPYETLSLIAQSMVPQNGPWRTNDVTEISAFWPDQLCHGAWAGHLQRFAREYPEIIDSHSRHFLTGAIAGGNVELVEKFQEEIDSSKLLTWALHLNILDNESLSNDSAGVAKFLMQYAVEHRFLDEFLEDLEQRNLSLLHLMAKHDMLEAIEIGLRSGLDPQKRDEQQRLFLDVPDSEISRESMKSLLSARNAQDVMQEIFSVPGSAPAV